MLDELEIVVAVAAGGHEDWPQVRLLVNGVDLAQVTDHPDHLGHDPSELLESPSPLLPSPWRRVALYRCSCGEAGCGNLTPMIVRRADGTVAWTDFRSYTGVFVGATVEQDPAGGDPLPAHDLVFAAEAYEREVRRAVSDRSWETPPRVTARLVREGLQLQHDDRLDQAGYRLQGVWPSRTDPNAVLIDLRRRGADLIWRQEIAHISASGVTAQERAEQMTDALWGVPVRGWAVAFPWRA